MKSLSLTLLLLFASAAHGEGGSFQLHLFSHHEGDGEYNEVHNGIGYTGPGELTYTLGYYKNSFSRDTFYAGGAYRINRVARIFAATASGYDDRQFIGGLMLRAFPSSDFAPTMTLAPGSKGLVVLFGVDYRY